MKFLVAGYGSIGRRHLRNLIALGQNDIVLLRSHKSTLPEEEIKDIPVETTVEAALSHRPRMPEVRHRGESVHTKSFFPVLSASR